MVAAVLRVVLRRPVGVMLFVLMSRLVLDWSQVRSIHVSVRECGECKARSR